MKSYLSKMRGEPIQRPRACWRDALWSWFGAFAGMLAISWLSAHWLSSQLLIVGSFGATSVLIYAVPASPLAQPRNVLIGSMLSAMLGVGCFQLLGATAVAVALSVSLAILVMQLTHTVHPPGAAAALIAVIGGPEVHALGWWYPLLPVGIGCALMLGVAILVNNLARHRRYPVHWR
ncbi:HPP family protein [Onishia taeanensis]|uniref:HPP family protein n=2 Tax=Onishia taeanensis TaxID=284577 RepID=A0A328Y0L6_9GAMM|nr:HPP family protein [Halomonas taeanensis]RAR64374.1 HPP family protein [Halomonas taeanensis]